MDVNLRETLGSRILQATNLAVMEHLHQSLLEDWKQNFQPRRKAGVGGADLDRPYSSGGTRMNEAGQALHKGVGQ